jgi:membrane protease YdiL (CAAX protease family)
MQDTPRNATLVYLLFTLIFSSVIWALIIWSGHLGMAFGMMITAVMWCPALATLVTCRVLGRDIRSLAWRWPAWRYIAAAYFLPLLYAGVSYGLVWALRLGGWNSELIGLVVQRFGLRGMPVWGVFALWLVFTATAGLIRGLSTALGEEIGWRGFLVPELAKQMSFTRLSLLSGIIWAAWHSPILLFADYNSGTNRWYALGCFAVMIVSGSFAFAWLCLKSGSLWTAAVLHASHNLFVQTVFDNLMRDTGKTLWYTTEFGIALAIANIVVAIYFWTRRAEVEQREMPSPLTMGVSQEIQGSSQGSLVSGHEL